MTDRERFAEPQRRTVQDDAREEQLAALLRLNRNRSRMGSDARDEFGNRFELKTTTTGNITTGRDIGPDYLDRLRSSYMICASGKQTQYGFSTDEIYFLSPLMMEDWIAGIERRIGGDRLLVDTALDQLRAVGRDEEDLKRLKRIGYRGITLNNPKISWAYVSAHGVRLEGEPALHLRELIAQFPIGGRS